MRKVGCGSGAYGASALPPLCVDKTRGTPSRELAHMYMFGEGLHETLVLKVEATKVPLQTTKVLRRSCEGKLSASHSLRVNVELQQVALRQASLLEG